MILALALAGTLTLLLLALALSASQSNQKGLDQALAQGLAHRLLEQEIYRAQQSASDPLWLAADWEAPYRVEQVPLGQRRYQMALYAASADSPATPRLRQLRLRLSWWDGDPARPGYGRLTTEVHRYVASP